MKMWTMCSHYIICLVFSSGNFFNCIFSSFTFSGLKEKKNTKLAGSCLCAVLALAIFSEQLAYQSLENLFELLGQRGQRPQLIFLMTESSQRIRWHNTLQSCQFPTPQPAHTASSKPSGQFWQGTTLSPPKISSQ